MTVALPGTKSREVLHRGRPSCLCRSWHRVKHPAQHRSHTSNAISRDGSAENEAQTAWCQVEARSAEVGRASLRSTEVRLRAPGLRAAAEHTPTVQAERLYCRGRLRLRWGCCSRMYPEKQRMVRRVEGRPSGLE